MDHIVGVLRDVELIKRVQLMVGMGNSVPIGVPARVKVQLLSDWSDVYHRLVVWPLSFPYGINPGGDIRFKSSLVLGNPDDQRSVRIIDI